MDPIKSVPTNVQMVAPSARILVSARAASVLILSGLCLVSSIGLAEATFMTGPKWTECNKKQVCFSMDGQDASTTYFASGRIFFRHVKFKLFGSKNRKIVERTLMAESAFSSDHEKIWYLQNSKGRDYSFDTSTMKLTLVAK